MASLGAADGGESPQIPSVNCEYKGDAVAKSLTAFRFLDCTWGCKEQACYKISQRAWKNSLEQRKELESGNQLAQDGEKLQNIRKSVQKAVVPERLAEFFRCYVTP
jgi:hypothetical protein